MNQHSTDWHDLLEHIALSDIGMRRGNNQDSYSVALASDRASWRRRGHLFLVADGMGAHVAGEMASKLATDNIPLSYSKYAETPPPAALRKSVEDANDLIHRRGQSSEDFKGMGTTSTNLLLLPHRAYVAHVGDSRAYRLRGAAFEQLTFDHSLVNEMRAAGQLPNDAALAFVPKNIITRSLGPNPEVRVDVEGPFPIQAGDIFLLCSDGLSGQVADTELGALLHCLPLKKAIRAMVDLANLRGGPDNITAIAVRVAAGPAAEDALAASDEASATPVRPIHPLVLTTLGVFVLAGLGMALLQQWAGALVSLVGAVAAGITALVQRHGATAPAADAATPLGRAAYVRCDATPDLDLVDRLGQVVQELDDATKGGQWSVDPKPFQASWQRAVTAKQQGRLGDAVREYCEALSYMMEELRRCGGRSPGDNRVV